MLSPLDPFGLGSLGHQVTEKRTQAVKVGFPLPCGFQVLLSHPDTGEEFYPQRWPRLARGEVTLKSSGTPLRVTCSGYPQSYSWAPNKPSKQAHSG